MYCLESQTVLEAPRPMFEGPERWVRPGPGWRTRCRAEGQGSKFLKRSNVQIPWLFDGHISQVHFYVIDKRSNKKCDLTFKMRALSTPLAFFHSCTLGHRRSRFTHRPREYTLVSPLLLYI